MTVKDLKQILLGVDEDKLVIMSRDSEGNLFSPLSDISTENEVYQADTTYMGEVHSKELTPELKAAGYSKEDIGEGEDCIVLWPTN